MVQRDKKRKCTYIWSYSFGKSEGTGKKTGQTNKESAGEKAATNGGNDAKLEQKVDELDGFKASEGWLNRFKHRHSIVFKSNQGEAADIDLEGLANWQADVLRNEILHFSADDIFNADETGLFWQLLPQKTLAFKGERYTSGKKSKERITALVGANMSGTEKLPLLVIGKSTKPREFKKKEVPIAYKANKKAWMTAELFEAWLKEWDRKLKREGRKVLLYLDNFSGHSKITLEQITMKFLPPNTTAESQPCDQGIIQNLKMHYRRFLLREMIAAMDDKSDFRMDLFKALQILRRSWSQVKPETVANCFRKAGFIKNVETMDQGQAVEDVGGGESQASDEMNTLWAALQAMSLVEGTLDDYLAADKQLATGGMISLAEIAADVSATEVEEPEVESDTDVMEVDEEGELPPVTNREAKDAVQILLRYSSNPNVLQLCDLVDDLVAEKRMMKLKQKKILDYFTLKTA